MFKSELIIFFHGFESSALTDKFTCIKHKNKFCVSVDYAKDLELVFKIYDKIVESAIHLYDTVILVGHSFGGWFANHYASKYNLKCLLIAPCLKPDFYLKDKISNINEFDFSFNQTAKEAILFIHEKDEILQVSDANFINNENYHKQYFKHAKHRSCYPGEINDAINELLNIPIGLMTNDE